MTLAHIFSLVYYFLTFVWYGIMWFLFVAHKIFGSSKTTSSTK